MAHIRELFSDRQPRTRDQTLCDLAAKLGYQRLGRKIAGILDDDLRTAVRRGILNNTAGQLTLLTPTITDYTRDHLIDMLLSAIGPGWIDREDALRTTARHLGFRRTGSTITTTLKSAINGAIRRGLMEYEGPRVRKVSGGG
jgi:hypothetical protein